MDLLMKSSISLLTTMLNIVREKAKTTHDPCLKTVPGSNVNWDCQYEQSRLCTLPEFFALRRAQPRERNHPGRYLSRRADSRLQSGTAFAVLDGVATRRPPFRACGQPSPVSASISVGTTRPVATWRGGMVGDSPCVSQSAPTPWPWSCGVDSTPAVL